jgi:phosphoketolase
VGGAQPAGAEEAPGADAQAALAPDRFNLVIDVIDRVPRLANKAAHLKESMKNDIISNPSYARDISDWTWPR